MSVTCVRRKRSTILLELERLRDIDAVAQELIAAWDVAPRLIETQRMMSVIAALRDAIRPIKEDEA